MSVVVMRRPLGFSDLSHPASAGFGSGHWQGMRPTATPKIWLARKLWRIHPRFAHVLHDLPWCMCADEATGPQHVHVHVPSNPGLGCDCAQLYLAPHADRRDVGLPDPIRVTRGGGARSTRCS